MIPKLLSYALDTLGPQCIQDAWREFNDFEPDEDHDPESPMNIVFMPWFLFRWIHETIPPGAEQFLETTIAESFLSDRSISDDEEKLLVSAIRCPYSLCEVVELKPGVGITLFDLLRRIKYEVVERSARKLSKEARLSTAPPLIWRVSVQI